MGLKVLLADESSTIKKAFQLALADFAVEVKSVPSGLDVLSVALDFSPDIIFADILLTKKPGYDVCKELKNNSNLKHVPVILMWSHFMEFDTAKAIESKYTDRIEKPFDTETLRNLVNKYVPKTDSHPLKGMIEFPEMPDFEESDTFVRQKTSYLSHMNRKDDLYDGERSQNLKLPPLPQPIGSAKNFNPIDPESIELVDEDFAPSESNQPTAFNFDQNKTTTDLEDLQIETENFGDFEEVTLVKSIAQSSGDSIHNNIQNQIHSYVEDSPVLFEKVQKLNTQLNSKFDEQLYKEEVRQMAEKICWQIIPDITEEIVREELSKLMKNLDK